MAAPMLARLTERALPFISRHIPTIDFLLVYLLIYNAVSVFSSVLRLFVNGCWSPLPIAKLQVAVWDPQRQVQHQLERIAAKAYTAGASSSRLVILQGMRTALDCTELDCTCGRQQYARAPSLVLGSVACIAPMLERHCMMAYRDG